MVHEMEHQQTLSFPQLFTKREASGTEFGVSPCPGWSRGGKPGERYFFSIPLEALI